MKKLFGAYRNSYMIRPTVYQVLFRFLIALVLSLLWNQYVDNYLRGLPFGLETFGIFYWLLVWFNYLKADGVAFLNLRRKNNGKKEKHKSHDMADFTDERVRPMDDLEDYEKNACRMVSNMITGTVLLLLGIILSFLM